MKYNVCFAFSRAPHIPSSLTFSFPSVISVGLFCTPLPLCYRDKTQEALCPPHSCRKMLEELSSVKTLVSPSHIRLFRDQSLADLCLQVQVQTILNYDSSKFQFYIFSTGSSNSSRSNSLKSRKSLSRIPTEIDADLLRKLQSLDKEENNNLSTIEEEG